MENSQGRDEKRNKLPRKIHWRGGGTARQAERYTATGHQIRKEKQLLKRQKGNYLSVCSRYKVPLLRGGEEGHLQSKNRESAKMFARIKTVAVLEDKKKDYVGLTNSVSYSIGGT